MQKFSGINFVHSASSNSAQHLQLDATNMSGALGVSKARSLSDAITLISFGAPRVAQMIIRFHLAPND